MASPSERAINIQKVAKAMFDGQRRAAFSAANMSRFDNARVGYPLPYAAPTPLSVDYPNEYQTGRAGRRLLYDVDGNLLSAQIVFGKSGTDGMNGKSLPTG